MANKFGKAMQALNAGVQSGLQTYGFIREQGRQDETMELRRQETLRAKESIDAYKMQVQSQFEQISMQKQSLARNLFNEELSKIAQLDDASRKAYVDTRFQFINGLATQGGFAPYAGSDELLKDSLIKPQSEALQNLQQVKKLLPKIKQGLATPEEVAMARSTSSSALNTLASFNRHNELDYKNYMAQAQEYNKIFDEYDSGRKPVAVADGRVITASDMETVKTAGNTEFRGIDERTGLPRVGRKLSEAERLPQEGAKSFKEVNKEFAKDYNDWTGGGAKIAANEIAKLRNVVNDLESGKVSTGGATGILPDRLTSGRVLKTRAAIESTVMKSLRALLGPQFTEKEGQRVIKATWNEADSTENNLTRVQSLLRDLEGQFQAKQEKVDYFTKKGTLEGYGVNEMSSEADIPVTGKYKLNF